MSKKIKRQLVILLLPALLVIMAVPASASSFEVLYPYENITYKNQQDGVIYINCGFDRPCFYWLSPNNVGSSYFSGAFDYIPTEEITSLRIRAFPLGTRITSGQPAIGSVIDVSDFKKNSVISLSFGMRFSVIYEYGFTNAGPDSSGKTNGVCIIHWYDKDGNYLKSVGIDDLVSVVPGNSNEITHFLINSAVKVSIPPNASYFIPMYNTNFTFPTEVAYVKSVKSDSATFGITVAIDSVIDQSETMKEIEHSLDQLLEQPEQEKQEANSSGNSAVDDLLSIVPDKSQGFITAIQSLADSMSYEGTACLWQFPALYIPEIPGLFPRYDLISAQYVDIEAWVNMIPLKLLRVTRTVLTAGLIVYCFKELYSVISYALTLGGTKDE